MFDKNELNQLREVVQEVTKNRDLIQIEQVAQRVVDNRDLQKLRGMMTEVIQETVPFIVGEALEQVVLPEIQELREEVLKMRSVMVTQDFLEKRLTDFRVNLTDSADWVGRQLKRLTHTMYQGELLTADQLIEIHAK